MDITSSDDDLEITKAVRKDLEVDGYNKSKDWDHILSLSVMLTSTT